MQQKAIIQTIFICNCLKMPTFLFLATICLIVAAFILLETDALPKKTTKLEKGSSSSGKAQSSPAPKANSLAGRMKHLLDTGHRADVHFLVGDEKEATAAAAAGTAFSEEIKHVEMPDEKVGSGKAESTPATTRPWNRLIDEIIDNSESRTLYTVYPIKKSGIFYYEVKVKVEIVKVKGYVSIGLGPKERIVGDYEGFAYDSCGMFLGYKAPGSTQSRSGRDYFNIGVTFGADDVVGCGVDFANSIIFYTKNGQRLGPVGEFVDSADDLFPRVSLTHPDYDIEENFGQQEFAYKF